MKTEAAPPLLPPIDPGSVVRLEGRTQVPISWTVGQQLDAHVAAVMQEGRALLDFGPFTLVARTEAPLQEGSDVRLVLRSLSPSIELQVVRERPLPDAAELTRALAGFLRDSAPPPAPAAGPMADPSAVDHPNWRAGVETLMKGLPVNPNPAQPDARPSDARDVEMAAKQSGVFLEAEAAATGAALAETATEITTIVENLRATAADLLSLLQSQKPPPAGLPAPGLPESSAARPTGTVEIEELLGRELLRGAPNADEIIRELLATGKAPEERIQIVDSIVAALRTMLPPHLLRAEPPEAEGPLLAVMERLAEDLREAVQTGRRTIADFASHAQADHKAALLGMASAAREMGQVLLSRKVETLVRFIEGFQAAAIADRKPDAKPFLMIPLPIAGENGREVAELKVFYRERGGRHEIDPENLSISVLLRMSSLGRIRTDARMDHRRVTCEIWTETDEVRAFVEQSLPGLLDGIRAAGFEIAGVSTVVDRRRIQEFHSFKGSEELSNRVLDVKI